MKIIKNWHRWWFRQAPPHALALLRIIFGAFLLFYWLLKLPDIPMFSSEEGLVTPLTTFVFFTPPPVWCAYLLYAVLIIALVCFTVGFQTRVASMIAGLLYLYEWIVSISTFGTSFDRLFIFTLLVLAFSGAGNALSADMRLSRGSWWAWEPTEVFVQRLIALQISATYLGVGWQKMVLEVWQGGEVLAVGFIGRWATPPAFAIARLNLPIWVYDLQLYAVKIFEILIPFGLWSKYWRWWFIAGGILFHVGIAVLLAIWWFVALIPAYIVFFEPEEVFGWLQRKSGGRIPSA